MNSNAKSIPKITKAARRPRARSEPETESQLASRASPLVFVSHDTRDADLAEAFDNLLTDASGWIVKSFRSSDRKGQAGIEYGVEWYPSVMSKLNDATDVVALLTPSSVDRPWILYEAGVAKGKLNTTVFGVALGLPLQKASVGPFAQFQNCAADEESLTKLVLQLIRRNPATVRLRARGEGRPRSHHDVAALPRDSRSSARIRIAGRIQEEATQSKGHGTRGGLARAPHLTRFARS